MDKIRDVLKIIKDEEQRLLKIRSQTPLQSRRITSIILIVLLCLSFFISTVAAFILSKSIIRPIRNFQAGTKIVGQGYLDYEFAIESKDEIGSLAASFNDMLAKLKSTLTSNESLKMEIEKRGIAEEKLRIVNQELESSNERLKIIGKLIRHDLANDFVVIKSAISLFLNTHDATMLNEIDKRVTNSLKSIEEYGRYQSLIEKSRSLASLEISEIIQEAVSGFPEIHTQVKGKCRVMADETLHSVFTNLMNNSVKHGASTKVDIAISSDKKYCTILFSDNGSGIPDEIMDNIFDEGFYFGETGNTGIGLHIVKNIIEGFNGSIRAEGGRAHGAAFIITLIKAIET